MAFVFSTVLLSVVKQSVIMPSVVAPYLAAQIGAAKTKQTLSPRVCQIWKFWPKIIWANLLVMIFSRFYY